MNVPPPRAYEFDEAQNATFATLAGAMTFVSIVMLCLSAVVVTAVVLLARVTVTGSAILAPLGLAVAVMGAQLFAAGRRFRRVVSTRGSDISNLMLALNEMAVAYRIQRWLWLTVLVAIALALLTTIQGS